MLKYLDDREDWIDLPVEDRDSFSDNIEMESFDAWKSDSR